MAAAVRVFLCTYRRNDLLRRAVDSLRNQTFADWVCELHNDDPADAFPGRLVAELGDDRITVVNHPSNLGPTRTFNLMYRSPAAERYLSLLEDDNWWEPAFLERMVAEMDARPNVSVAWANMRFWQEQTDGSWMLTGGTTWDEGDGSPRLFHWPHPQQVRGAVHSNGAMLLRTSTISNYSIPDSTPFAVIECVRERRFIYPLLLMPTPLANFAVTRSTSRGNDRTLWEQCQALLVASFIRNVALDKKWVAHIWNEARYEPTPATTSLIVAGLCDSASRHLLRHAKLRDWLRFTRAVVRRPMSMLRVLRAKTELADMWQTLDESTCVTQKLAGFPNRFRTPECDGMVNAE